MVCSPLVFPCKMHEQTNSQLFGDLCTPEPSSKIRNVTVRTSKVAVCGGYSEPRAINKPVNDSELKVQLTIVSCKRLGMLSSSSKLLRLQRLAVPAGKVLVHFFSMFQLNLSSSGISAGNPRPCYASSQQTHHLSRHSWIQCRQWTYRDRVWVHWIPWKICRVQAG